MNRKISISVSGFVLGILMVLPLFTACAATTFYVKVEGRKQGSFNGQRTGSRAGWIPCEEFKYQSEPSGDAATGRASGRRASKTITITKVVDASSTQFAKAQSTNELLPAVDFEFVHEGDKVYKKARLTDALVSSIRTISSKGVSARSKGAELEEISFTFRQIEFSSVNGKTTATDDWLQTK
jgi:type VI secretion system Hcp family effector